MGLHTSGHTRKNSSFSTQDEHQVLLGLEALTDGPQPPLRDTLYYRSRAYFRYIRCITSATRGGHYCPLVSFRLLQGSYPAQVLR